MVNHFNVPICTETALATELFFSCTVDIHDMLLGIDVEATTPSWQADCYLLGKDYMYLNNLVQMRDISAADECQRMCQLTLDCMHFTFHMTGETKGHCYLKSNFGLSQIHDVAHSISGPKFCS